MVLKLFFLVLVGWLHVVKPATLVLDPARDARDVGRTVGDSFERGITLQFVRELKNQLHALWPTLEIIIPPGSSDSYDRWYRANYANCLQINWYITIHCYQERSSHPFLHIYYFVRDPMSDFFWRPRDGLYFLALDQAHQPFLQITQRWTQQLFDAFATTGLKKHFHCTTPLGIPFKPLKGINASALALEIGLLQSDDWRHSMPLLAQSIYESLQLFSGIS